MHDDPARTSPGDGESRGAVAEPTSEEPLRTVRLNSSHRVADFNCSKSERVQKFLRQGTGLYQGRNFSRVFILPDPDDPMRVWGYYTLSAAFIVPEDTSKTQRKRTVNNIPTIPMARVGYMGRDDASQQGLGAALILDAARRVYRQ